MGTPSPSFPTAPSMKPYSGLPRPLPPRISRCSAPHLPIVSPPLACGLPLVTPSRSAPSTSLPTCSSTRTPPPPRTPSPLVSRSLAAFPGALAEPPRVGGVLALSWVPTQRAVRGAPERRRRRDAPPRTGHAHRLRPGPAPAPAAARPRQEELQEHRGGG